MCLLGNCIALHLIVRCLQWALRDRPIYEFNTFAYLLRVDYWYGSGYEMGSIKANEAILETMRTVLGSEASDMEIIRVLHLAKNDIEATINIIFNTLGF